MHFLQKQSHYFSNDPRIPEIFIEISILIQVLELSNMNNVCPGEIFSHPTPMGRTLSYTNNTNTCIPQHQHYTHTHTHSYSTALELEL